MAECLYTPLKTDRNAIPGCRAKEEQQNELIDYLYAMTRVSEYRVEVRVLTGSRSVPRGDRRVRLGGC